MSLLNYLRKRTPSASIAKERLQIIISHERAQRSTPDYLPKLQEEIIEVISKYVPIDKNQVMVNLDRQNDNSAVLELNITMPEEALASSCSSSAATQKPSEKHQKKKEKANASEA